MIEKIIEYSIKNRFIVILGTLLLILIGSYSVYNTPLDAIPDLSDVQVILFTEFAGQTPRVVEDQITYPLTTAMLSVPFAKVVRGYSFFGLSFVYIIFGYFILSSSSPSRSIFPIDSEFEGRSSSIIISIVAFAAAVEMGFPPNVEIVSFFSESATSSVAIVAPRGIPFAIPFAVVIISGSTS